MSLVKTRPQLLEGEVAVARFSGEQDSIGRLVGETTDRLIVRLPSTEGSLPAPGAWCYVAVVGFETDGTAIVSKDSPLVVTRLLEGLVPELSSGQVRIMRIAREPGRRTKVAVATSDADLDPVAAVVGRTGWIVNFVAELLGGERIEVIPWSPRPEVLLARAFAPAKVESVTIDDDGTATVRVAPHMMAPAVGQDGLNSILAARLAGKLKLGGRWRIPKVTVVSTEDLPHPPQGSVATVSLDGEPASGEEEPAGAAAGEAA